MTEPITSDRDIITSHGIFLFFFMPSPYLNILYNTIKELNLSSTYSVGVMLQCDFTVMESGDTFWTLAGQFGMISKITMWDV